MNFKVVVLLSGGIDSPVASHLISEVGAEVNLLYLDNRPFTDDKTIDVIVEIAEHLIDTHGDMRCYSGSFGEVQKRIAKEGDPHFRCLLCRRMMYGSGKRLAEKVDADAIVTGESLGQVASQTLSNLSSVHKGINIPILRPLIGLDKTEIIEIAREIGTYESSIKPTTCCMLTPEEPRIRSDPTEIEEQEKNISASKLKKGITFERVLP